MSEREVDNEWILSSASNLIPMYVQPEARPPNDSALSPLGAATARNRLNLTRLATWYDYDLLCPLALLVFGVFVEDLLLVVRPGVLAGLDKGGSASVIAAGSVLGVSVGVC